MTNDAERTYRGPIIERGVEDGVIEGSDSEKIVPNYALAVDEGTSEIIIVFRSLQPYWSVSTASLYPRVPGTDSLLIPWTVTP